MAGVLPEMAFDANARTISLNGVETRLTPKSATVLSILLAANGRVVSRQELLDRVWPDVAVVDEVLTQAIAELRRALGDNARQPQYIETVAKSGYRFLGQLQSTAPAQEAEPDAPELECSFEHPSLVVVPFEAISTDTSTALLSKGLTRDLAASLAKSRWLFVSAFASATASEVAHVEPLKVAEALHVRYALWGSVIISGNRMRVMARLCDRKTASLLWAEHFERPISDLFDVLDEIGQEIAKCVEAVIEAQLRRIARLTPIKDLDAWGLYHRASGHRFAAARETITELSELLAMARALEPSSARIAAAQATLQFRKEMLLTRPTEPPRLVLAPDMARAAIELDEFDPDAMTALGSTLIVSGCRDEGMFWMSQACRHNPNSVNARNLLAWTCLIAGHKEEAMTHAAYANRISPLDPVGYSFHCVMAQSLALSGNVKAAMVHSERAASHRNANVQVYAVAALCALLADRGDIAMQHLARVRNVTPDFSAETFLKWFPFSGSESSLIRETLAA
ncbi:winged helix-turn-helix domain-containing protein [uncultured Roseobacter sp.]|uniref:winged helix-turn-helix domain-containing protein n=1 Tax=uncultured Roseobacter sp. TaxID=114847 RepID=UPI00262EA0CB|nr:winged helix-turn-helix domain-containing protein [uncultured Roseobacter sp.]